MSQIRDLERRASAESGISSLDLMENAGRAAAAEVMKAVIGKTALVICGYGNNGGDGLVAARHLAAAGYDVRVIIAGPPKSFTAEVNHNLERLFSAGIKPEIVSSGKSLEETFDKMAKPGVVVDAIFGIGLKGAVDSFHEGLINKINSLGSPVVSLDIPSGLDADTGKHPGACVKADVTVTFGFPKTGFASGEAKRLIGKLVISDIGLGGMQKPDSARPPQDNTLRARSGRQGPVRPGHPWIFKDRYLKPSRGIKQGQIITFQDKDGNFYGRGYYNSASEIAIRILTFKDEPIDAEFFRNRIRAAFDKRRYLAGQTDAYRAVFSEADGLPGLVVDIYKDTAVFQLLTLGMDKLRALIAGAIEDVIRPSYIYEKSVSPFGRVEGVKETRRWHGKTGSPIIEIFEGRLKFLVDIEKGHKTGFYLDQRRSRMALEAFSKNKRVLDLFCYTGAFAVSALVFGASRAVGIDVKGEWLELAEKNAALNGVSGRSRFIKSDAFAYLRDLAENGEKFDLIILDPPSFLKTRVSLESARKGYRELNLLAMKALVDGGVLATFSCSHNMPNETFSGIIKEAADRAGKRYAILKRCRQAQDHPVIREIPETEYLKGYYLKINET